MCLITLSPKLSDSTKAVDRMLGYKQKGCVHIGTVEAMCDLPSGSMHTA